MSGWDRMYSVMVEKAPYKTLMLIPPIISLLMIGFMAVNGFEMGLEFKGGTWVEVLTDIDFSGPELDQLELRLTALGLNDADLSVGYDVDTGLNKLVVTTTNVLDDAGKDRVKAVLEDEAGELSEFDVVSINYGDRIPAGFGDKLNKRLGQRVDYVQEDGVLTVRALNLDEEEVERVLEYYLGGEYEARYQPKNFNSKTVGAILGETFRSQGQKAVMFAFILMAIVVFIAFKDLVPSFAVMLAAGCDIALTMGAMSILGIPLEPASLAALLMLIGYSVDSDILLTVRVLRERRGNVNERIDNAMKTGLTMTGTTLAVMMVVYIVSTTLTQIYTLRNIAEVLLLGLFGDLFTTWFTNAGLLKWYIEEKKGGRR